MKKLLTVIFVALMLVSIAAPAWADVVSSPIVPAMTEVIPVLVACCCGLFAVAAAIVGVVVIVKYNKKKAGN